MIEADEFRLRVVGVPQPQGSSRAFVRGGRPVVTSDNPSLRHWRDLVAYAASQALWSWTRVAGPVTVTLSFALPRPKTARRAYPITRPDVDKLARGVLDALTGVVFDDDAQVVALVATKHYAEADATPGVEVVVRRMEGRR